MAENILYLWGPVDGLDSSSPFSLKVLYALRAKGVPHRKKYVGKNLPSWITRGRCPAIELEGKQIQDSTPILHAIDEASSEGPRLYPQEPALRAETMLLEDWADESLALFAVWYRWSEDKYWGKFLPQLFRGKPPIPVRLAFNLIFRKRVVRALKDQGLGDLPEQERQQKYADALWMLNERLRTRPFFVWLEPTAADFAIFPHLQTAMAGGITELSEKIEAQPRVMEWIKKMESLTAKRD